MSPPGKEVSAGLTAELPSTKAAELPEGMNIGGLVPSDPKDGFGQSGDQLSNSSYSSSSSVTVTSSSSSSESKLGSATEVRDSSTVATTEPEPQDGEQYSSTKGPDVGGRLVLPEVRVSLENGEKEPSSSSPSSEEKGPDSGERGKKTEEDEENDEDGSRKEDYSEGDLVDISAYSGLGEEDSGGSQLDDEEEEDEEAYQPESSCSEIPGLPEEEEPAPANRKIRFSTGAIKVSDSSVSLMPRHVKTFLCVQSVLASFSQHRGFAMTSGTQGQGVIRNMGAHVAVTTLVTSAGSSWHQTCIPTAGVPEFPCRTALKSFIQGSQTVL